MNSRQRFKSHLHLEKVTSICSMLYFLRCNDEVTVGNDEVTVGNDEVTEVTTGNEVTRGKNTENGGPDDSNFDLINP